MDDVKKRNAAALKLGFLVQLFLIMGLLLMFNQVVPALLWFAGSCFVAVVAMFAFRTSDMRQEIDVLKKRMDDFEAGQTSRKSVDII